MRDCRGLYERLQGSLSDTAGVFMSDCRGLYERLQGSLICFKVKMGAYSRF